MGRNPSFISYKNIYKWRPPSLSELTPIIQIYEVNSLTLGGLQITYMISCLYQIYLLNFMESLVCKYKFS